MTAIAVMNNRGSCSIEFFAVCDPSKGRRPMRFNLCGIAGMPALVTGFRRVMRVTRETERDTKNVGIGDVRFDATGGMDRRCHYPNG
jgi:hypothetical protein